MSRLRNATEADVSALAALWTAGWTEAHAAHVPPSLLAERTPESFRIRITGLLPQTRVAETDDGRLLGFCTIHTRGRGELHQLFVAPEARGTGMAELLLADGERRLKAAGCSAPELDCLPQNQRAARFYARQGWRSRGVETVSVPTVSGSYQLDCLVFEKNLATNEEKAS